MYRKTGVTESVVEEATLNWMAERGYAVLHGPDIALGELLTKRDSYEEVVLVGRLQEALERLNPKIPTEALEEALRKSTRPEGPSLVANNRMFHRMLTDGIDVEFLG